MQTVQTAQRGKRIDYSLGCLRKIFLLLRTVGSWPALILQSPIDLRSLSPHCLRRRHHKDLSRSDCGWWGVSALCCHRRIRELSGSFGVGVCRSSVACKNGVSAHPPTWLIGFPIIQRGRYSVEFYEVVQSMGWFASRWYCLLRKIKAGHQGHQDVRSCGSQCPVTVTGKSIELVPGVGRNEKTLSEYFQIKDLTSSGSVEVTDVIRNARSGWLVLDSCIKRHVGSQRLFITLK